jgi:predicted dehydrogenase
MSTPAHPGGVPTGPQGLVPDPMLAPPLRWGVLGPGWIAERFIDAVRTGTRQEVVAVASRERDRARAFADRRSVPHAYGSYEELVTDPDVDVVYVATPHPAHHACALLAIEAGKHVLVEKPLALNEIQASDIAEAAGRRGVFAMEAMWTFFLPKMAALRAVLDGGVVGQPVSVIADHGEHFGPDHRIMRADLAGGPLLDLGTYPVALAVAVLGPVGELHAVGRMIPAGVQGQISIAMGHERGGQSALHTTVLSNTPTAATIAGTDGTVTVDGPFFTPGPFTVSASDGRELGRYDEPRVGHAALHFQAAELARCVAAGRLESAIRPLAESVRTMGVLDRIRERIGTTYDVDSSTDSDPDRSEQPA